MSDVDSEGIEADAGTTADGEGINTRYVQIEQDELQTKRGMPARLGRIGKRSSPPERISFCEGSVAVDVPHVSAVSVQESDVDETSMFSLEARRKFSGM